MKIQNISLKKINVTALFDKVDQSHITSDEIRNLFSLKAQDRANTPFIELPGTKVLIIPTQKKEIVIEPNRLRVTDSSMVSPSESIIISDFEKVFNAFSGKSKLRAYGYNYDILLQFQGEILYEKLLSPSLLSMIDSGSLLEAGARVVYSKKGRKFDIQIAPGGQKNQLEIHANTHYEVENIDFSILSKQLPSDFKEVEQAIKKFTQT